MSERAESSASDIERDEIERREDIGEAQARMSVDASEDGGSDYQLRGVLKIPRAANYTTSSLCELLAEDRIIFDLDYQRVDTVWPEAKQSRLIDSIMRNYYIPPIIFALGRSEDGDDTRVCIDGKQRLMSIFRFMSGEIPFKDHSTQETFFYKHLDDGAELDSRTLLPLHYRRLFSSKSLECVEYEDLPGNAERDLYDRLQLGSALNIAERLKGLTTPTAELVKSIYRKYLANQENSTSPFLNINRHRDNDFRDTCLTLMSWMEDTSATSENLAHLRSQSERVFDTLLRLVQDGDAGCVLSTPPQLSSMEFVATVLLTLAHLQEAKSSDLDLVSSIERMRLRARQQQSARTNAGGSQAFLDLIRGADLQPLTPLFLSTPLKATVRDFQGAPPSDSQSTRSLAERLGSPNGTPTQTPRPSLFSRLPDSSPRTPHRGKTRDREFRDYDWGDESKKRPRY